MTAQTLKCVDFPSLSVQLIVSFPYFIFWNIFLHKIALQIILSSDHPQLITHIQYHTHTHTHTHTFTSELVLKTDQPLPQTYLTTPKTVNSQISTPQRHSKLRSMQLTVNYFSTKTFCFGHISKTKGSSPPTHEPKPVKGSVSYPKNYCFRSISLDGSSL
jgi:hypothetical protein